MLATTPELLVTGSDDHTLFLWSLFPSSVPSSDIAVSQGKLKPITRLTGHQRQISHVAFSPDGRWAASSSWDSSIRLWEGRTGKYVATLRGHVGAVYRLAWSADGRMLVSASKDATVKVGYLHQLVNDIYTNVCRYGISKHINSKLTFQVTQMKFTVLTLLQTRSSVEGEINILKC